MVIELGCDFDQLEQRGWAGELAKKLADVAAGGIGGDGIGEEGGPVVVGSVDLTADAGLFGGCHWVVVGALGPHPPVLGHETFWQQGDKFGAVRLEDADVVVIGY